MSLSTLLLASTGRERSGSREGARREHEALSSELEALTREHKKLRQVVDQLARDYEDSKDYDPVRRYEKLKGMIKRTIMHVKLNPDEPLATHDTGVGGLVQGCRDLSHHVESARRREEKYTRT